MNGLLLVDKPEDWTSHDIVAKIRGILEKESRLLGEKKRVKVGHAGTLDPFATGLLLVLVGSATKSADKFLKLDKSYETTFILGASSSTDDKDGEIDQKAANKLNKAVVIDELEKFKGNTEQIPPNYSAIKVKGKRAYKSARKGEQVKLEPRNVAIYDINNIEYDWPKLRFELEVSSGTYIRSIARDLGQKLGVGGYVHQLRRTKVGTYNVQSSTAIGELNYNLIQKSILPLD